MRPERIPSTAASEIQDGVGKSGSPALRSMMSLPSVRSFRARVLTAMVAEGRRRCTLGLNSMGADGWRGGFRRGECRGISRSGAGWSKVAKGAFAYAPSGAGG